MTPKAADAYMAAHGISAGLPAVGDEKGGAPKGNSNASKNNAKRKKSVSGCFSPASEVDVESQPGIITFSSVSELLVIILGLSTFLQFLNFY
jgi:hypothetical protein